jgi:anthranilate synthase/aminodeoxychorismate synthase-like glutamine amidotransferase
MPVHGKIAEIYHDDAGIFAGLPQGFSAARYHSLVVDRLGLPASLAVTAWASDGEIMGVRHRDYPIEGIQFHPESILTSQGKNLLRNFLKAPSREDLKVRVP